MDEAAAVLDLLGSVGPYFTVRHGERADPEGFRPVADLYAADDALAPYVRSCSRRMGTDQGRVAASTFQLGFASRLWSVALGSALLDGRVPDLSPSRLHARQTADGGIELWLPEPQFGPEATRPAESLRAQVAFAHLRPLHETLRSRYALSPQVLHGNAASALVGSLRVLANRRPDVEGPGAALVSRLLAGEPLTDSGEFIVEEGLGFAFLRNNCCLYYRVPGGGLCGDCVRRRPRPAEPSPRP
ncbi:(2Fe-2S)-binding protein [Streptomyces sp. NBC_00344]|uniref:(2Fe-2S)-binding protein n=1 Tax=Streptomyces sp. NBC_00344 TaxID=2975720 RepID=UPI002E1FF794